MVSTTDRTDEHLLRDAPGEEYDGPAEVSAGDARDSGDGPIAVRVELRGRFEPLDGRFHWYGRIAADAGLAARHRSGTTVVLTTPRGAAEGRLSDVDPWGRFRISGTGRPPF